MTTSTLKPRPLSAALQKIASAELNEVPEKIGDDIAALRDWIEKQPHLKARTNAQFLVAFLRFCKYSLEQAKQKLENYYALRALMPEFFQGFVEDQRTRAIIRLGLSLHLPLPLQENGPRIVILRNGHYSVDDFALSEIAKVNVLCFDLQLLKDDNAVVCGNVQIFDFEKFTSAHFFQMDLTTMGRATQYVQEGLPLVMKAAHLINTNATFEKVFALMRPLVPAAFKERMHMHPNMESLYEHVPQRLLPKEYGGENSSIDEIIAQREADLITYREYLLEEKNYGVDEKARVGATVDPAKLFGVEGSFRKLNLD